MDVAEFVQYLQLMDTLITAIGVATFLFMVGSAYPEVNGVESKVPVKPNRPSEHDASFGPRPL